MTPEQRARMDRNIELFRIADDNFKGGPLVIGKGYLGVFGFSLRGDESAGIRGILLDVSLHNNLIRVYSPEHFGDAVRLAELYEESGEPEFTVRKEY